MKSGRECGRNQDRSKAEHDPLINPAEYAATLGEYVSESDPWFSEAMQKNRCRNTADAVLRYGFPDPRTRPYTAKNSPLSYARAHNEAFLKNPWQKWQAPYSGSVYKADKAHSEHGFADWKKERGILKARERVLSSKDFWPGSVFL